MHNWITKDTIKLGCTKGKIYFSLILIVQYLGWSLGALLFMGYPPATSRDYWQITYLSIKGRGTLIIFIGIVYIEVARKLDFDFHVSCFNFMSRNILDSVRCGCTVCCSFCAVLILIFQCAIGFAEG